MCVIVRRIRLVAQIRQLRAFAQLSDEYELIESAIGEALIEPVSSLQRQLWAGHTGGGKPLCRNAGPGGETGLEALDRATRAISLERSAGQADGDGHRVGHLSCRQPRRDGRRRGRGRYDDTCRMKVRHRHVIEFAGPREMAVHQRGQSRRHTASKPIALPAPDRHPR